MSFFKDLDVETGIEVSEDKIGGGSFAKVDKTGLYDFTITKAYAGTSSGGAFSVTLHLETEDGARLTITEYITSGSAKGCKNYYLDKEGKKQYLPGYNKIKNLDALLGFDRTYPSTTKSAVMLYDFDSKKELPVEKEVITEWIGKSVSALIIKTVEDKYSNPSESRDVYNVEHFLDAKTKQTRNEKVAGLTGFKDKWLAKFTEDYVIDKRVESLNSTGSSDTSASTSDDCPF